MSVRLAVLLIVCTVAFLLAVTTAGGLWLFGLVFFYPVLRCVGVRVTDEGRDLREIRKLEALYRA